ncbi:zinc ribbon domain-containing protein [Thermodesulfobacteriota bacterium]
MRDKIRQLIQLQECDNNIHSILKIKNAAPVKIQQLDDDLKTRTSLFQEEADRLEILKKERRLKEQEIVDLEQKIEKSNSKLLNIKSNKEYKAALKEIDDLKHAISLVEDQVLEIMEAVDALEEKSSENQEKQTELNNKYQTDRGLIEEQLIEVERQLADFEKQQKKLCQATDPDLFSRYRFIKEHKGEQAISPVILGVCQTCHMGIPPQKFNELKKGDSLLTCPNCNRIIYWGEDENFQFEDKP